jgi:hypothetical protein
MRILLLLAWGPTLFAGAPMDASITEIRAKYASVKKLESKMKIKKLDAASGESAEGSKAEVFRYGAEIKEIREEYFGESGKSKYYYFYENGRPFFVLLEETNYSLPLMEPVPGLPKPTKSTIEHRHYFKGELMIRWLKGKEEIKPTSEEFKGRGNELLKSAQDALKFAAESDQ